jgi:hypothetical protein
MAILKRFELARQYCSTTGTGPLVLGAAVPGYLTYAQAGAVNGDTVTYSIRDGVNSEVGWGPYGAGPSITARNVIKSTNANLPINLSGSSDVFCGVHAADFGVAANQALLLDDTGKIPAVDGTLITGVVKIAGSIMSGDLIMDKASPLLSLKKTASGQTNQIWGQTGVYRRWTMELGDGAVETGSNVGSDFTLTAFADNDSPLTYPLVIKRSSGVVTFSAIPVLPSNNPTTSDQAARKAYVDTKLPLAGGTLTGNLAGTTFSMSGPCSVNSLTTVNLTASGDIALGNNGFFAQAPSGKLLLGREAVNAGYYANAQCMVRHPAGVWGISILNSSGSAATAIAFQNYSSIVCGSIDTYLDYTDFTTTSDVRLKTDIEPFGNGREILDRLSVKNFTWKKSGNRDLGLIAQEVADVYPKAVGVGHGEPDEEGFVPYRIDNSKLVPVLIQALQEAFKKIDALEARLEQRGA